MATPKRFAAWARTHRNLLLGACLTPFLSGCWDVATTNPTSIPVVLGVDWHHGKYQTTVSALAPNLLTANGTAHTSPFVWVRQGSGSTVVSALEAAGLAWGQPTTLDHVEVLVLGKNALAYRRFQAILDAWTRPPFLHQTLHVYATAGRASSVVSATIALGPNPADVLNHQARASQWRQGFTRLRFDRLVGQWWNAPQDAAVIPAIGMGQRLGEGSVNYVFSGAWVVSRFSAPRPISRLQVRLWAWLANQAAPATSTIVAKRNPVTLLVDTNRTRFRWEAGGIQVTDHLSVDVLATSRTSTRLSAQTVAEAAAKKWTAQEMQVIDWAKAHHADIFQWGRAIATEKVSGYPVPSTKWSLVFAKTQVALRLTVRVRSFGAYNRA